MKNISEIYTIYKIPNNLREHMFRVAAVASIICDNIDIHIKKQEIITACLLHDMGNIIKFKLGYFPEFLKPEGFEYWQNVQNEYFQKYGKDEHKATIEIAKELKVSDSIIDLINSISFLGAPKNASSEDFNLKIPGYCDDRVDPFGVVPLEERLADLRKRYIHKGGDTSERQAFERAVKEIEKQIFSKCKIKPEDINNETVAPIISKLRDFMIK